MQSRKFLRHVRFDAAHRASARRQRRNPVLRAAIEALEPRQLLSNSIMVTNVNDSGSGSLRAAIATENSGGGGTITFASALAGQTIELSTAGDPTFGPTALAITSNITLDGGSDGITISQNTVGSLRLFYVEPSASLTLQNLTISNGLAEGGDGNLYGSAAGAAGLGGAIVNAGTLQVIQSTLTGNQARGGNTGNGSSTGGGGLGGNGGNTGGAPNGGSYGANGGFGGGGGADGGNGGFGGGGAAGGAGGFGGGGGGRDALGSNTHQPGFGGGVGNSNFGYPGGGGGAGMGGAIFNYGGIVSITNSTLTNNDATGGTGYTNGQGLGGAIFNLNGTVTATFTTIANNIAAQGGGGIYSLGDNGIPTQSGSTLTTTSSLSPATVTLTDSILAGSNNGTATLVSDYVQHTNNSGDGGGTGYVSSSGSSDIIQTPAGSGSFAGTAENENPELGSLASNGGPTQTAALLPGSPAIAAGVTADYPGTSTPITTDQRGALRTVTPSIGAFDSNYSLVVNSSADNVNDDNLFGPTITLREAVNFVDASGGNATITFDPTVFATAQVITLASKLELSNANGSTTITGPAAGVTISGNSAVEVLEVDTDVTANLSGLTIANGTATDGGGILNSGILIVSNDTFTHNAASNSGGAICNNAVLTVLDSTISQNTSGNIAGGINGNSGSTLIVSGSTIDDNSAAGYGGGLLVTQAVATIVNSIFSNNSATLSGGAIEDTGAVTVLSSTLTGNQAGPTGGGGAIDNFDGNYILKIGDSILAGNLSLNAPDVSNSVTSLGNNLIGQTTGSSGWVASDLTGTSINPLNPLLAPLGNYGGPTQTLALLPGSPAIDAGSGLLSTSNSQLIAITGTTGTFNLTFNGAPTNTLGFNATDTQVQNALNSLSTIGGVGGSVTVSGSQGDYLVVFGGTLSTNESLITTNGAGGTTISTIDIPGTDQRGVARPQGTPDDIGSFESSGFTIAAGSDATPQSTTTGTAFTNALGVTVTANNPVEPVAGGVISYSAPTSEPTATLSSETATIGKDGTADVTATAGNSVGSYDVTASASGIASSATFSLTNLGATSIGITAPPITYDANGVVTLTVSSSAGTPTGSVSLSVDSGSPITQTLVDGSTTFELTGLHAGSHTLSATYTSQGSFVGNSNTGSLTVNQANAILNITGASSAYTGTGHAATGTATGIESPTAANLTSLLHLSYENLATSSVSSSAPVAGGTYEVFANFDGNTDYKSLASFDTGQQVVISKLTPIFTVTSAVNISYQTASVTLSGKLASGLLYPTGSVSITLNHVTQSVAIGANGTFSSSPFNTSTLAVGSYNVCYSYPGGVSFNAASTTSTLNVGDNFTLLVDSKLHHHDGSTIPIIIALTNAAGKSLPPSATTVTAIGIANISTGVPGSLQPVPNSSPSKNVFTANSQHNLFKFALNTQGMTPGTYVLYFTISGDPTTHSLTLILVR